MPVPSPPHCTRRKLPLQASHLPGSLLTLHTPRHCPSPWARLPLLYTFSCLQAPLDIPPDPTLDTACAITPHAGHQGATVLVCSPPLPRSLALSSTSFPVPTAPGGPGFLSVGESLQQHFRAPACPSPCSPHLHLLLPFHSVGPRVSGASSRAAVDGTGKGRGGGAGSEACVFVGIPGVGQLRFVPLGTVYLDSEGEERKMTLLGDTVTSQIRKDPKPDRCVGRPWESPPSRTRPWWGHTEVL